MVSFISLQRFKMTEQDRIENWLTKTKWMRLFSLSIVSLLLLVGAVVVLGLTWAVLYGVLWMIFNSLFSEGLYLVPYLSAGFVLILFHGHLTTKRSYLTEYSFITGTAHDEPVTVMAGGSALSTINPLAPDSAHSYVKMIVSVLYTGPNMCMALRNRLARIYHWFTLDREGTARVLAFLLDQEEKIPMSELIENVPQGQNPEKILQQLLEMDGVLFLKNEGPAISLTSELRSELEEHISEP